MENKNETTQGALLAKKISSSRQAVFKAVNALKEEGVPIISAPQKGYRMAPLDDIREISPTMIEYFLKDVPLFHTCLYMKETTSTQRVIKKLAAENAEEGVIAVAEVQTEGRGRRGRSWQSLGGENLTFSVLLRPKLRPNRVQLLNLAAGLAMKETLRGICDIPAELKWPNDVLCRGRKLCGVLSEAAGEPDRIYYAVTGIGLNVNMKASDVPKELSETATSVLVESGKIFPRWKLLVDFLKRFAGCSKLLTEDGAEEFLGLYRESCDTLGKDVRVAQDGETYEGRALDVTDEGALIVKLRGVEKTFAAADVSHIRLK